MIKKVIKKSGKKQKFSQKKLERSIKLAAKQARLSLQTQKVILEKTLNKALSYLDSFDEVTTAQIRDLVLQQLNSMNKAVVKAWLSYEIKKISKKKF